MTVERQSVSYRPGWSFAWDVDLPNYLLIRKVSPDSTDPSRSHDAVYGMTVPDDQDFGEWLLNRLHGIEYHETCEWLRVDGRLVVDVHADENDPRGLMPIAPLVCPGSGQYPLENALLDTVPGMNPSGTCAVCKKSMTLRGYRLPQHGQGEGHAE